MKKLFSFDNGMLFVKDAEKRIFQISVGIGAQSIYVDSAGRKIEYEHGAVIDEDEEDPYFAFTTHEITEDVDGEYGCFGIKSRSGEIIAEEQWYQIGHFQNGLCPVKYEDSKWGCVNEKGELVLPYIYWDPPYFNKYGIAYGNDGLMDMEGNTIPDTEFNCIEHIDEDMRYINIVLLNEEQDKIVEECGSAPGITTDIFDSKTRQYVVRGIPQRILLIWDDVEPEVVETAADMVNDYDSICISEPGFIICRKNRTKTVFDYYD